VGAIDPEQEHSICMEAFADAGIYVLVSLFPYDLLKSDVDATWDTTAYNYSIATIDTMGKYTNLLGFYAPFFGLYTQPDPELLIVKAVVRDAKAYIASKEMCQIPVGSLTHTSESDSNFSDGSLDFLSCGEIHSDFVSVLNGTEGCLSVEWINDSGTRFERASMPVILLSTDVPIVTAKEKRRYTVRQLSLEGFYTTSIIKAKKLAVYGIRSSQMCNQANWYTRLSRQRLGYLASAGTPAVQGHQVYYGDSDCQQDE
jgi:hypothetical protein